MFLDRPRPKGKPRSRFSHAGVSKFSDLQMRIPRRYRPIPSKKRFQPAAQGLN